MNRPEGRRARPRLRSWLLGRVWAWLDPKPAPPAPPPDPRSRYAWHLNDLRQAALMRGDDGEASRLAATWLDLYSDDPVRAAAGLASLEAWLREP